MEYLGKIVDKKDLTTTEQVENYVAEFGGQIDTITVDNILVPIDQYRNAAIALDYKANVAYVDEELAKKANSSELATVSFSGSYNDLSDQPDDKFALITDTGNKIDLEIDNETYQLVAKLYNKNNNLISTSNIIDLPIEELVINVSFKSETHELIITLKNGTKVEIPLSSIINGLATQQWVEDKGYAIDNTLAVIAKSGSYNDLEDTPIIPEVPTKVSVFENDAGYVTNSVVNGYATEEWVESKNYLTQHQDISGKANQSYVDAELEKKADKTEIPSLDGYATEKWVENKNYLTEHQDISSKTDKSYVDTELAKKADKITLADVATSGSYTDLSNAPTNVSTFTNDVGYLTAHQDISNKADLDYVNAELNKKANIEDIPVVPTNVSAFTNDIGYLTQHQSLEGYATQAFVTTKIGEINIPTKTSDLENDSGFITTAYHDDSKQNIITLENKLSYNLLKDTPEIPIIPTKISAFTNDAGYLTEHQSLEGYATKDWVEDKGYLTEHQDISGKADTEYVNTQLNTKADKTDIPVIPTDISAFNNDVGYLTEHQDISGKQNIITDLDDIRTGAGLGSTAVQPLTLAQTLSAYRTAEAQDIIDADIPSSAKDLILGENISVQVDIGGYKAGDIIDADTSVFDVLLNIFSASN